MTLGDEASGGVKAASCRSAFWLGGLDSCRAGGDRPDPADGKAAWSRPGGLLHAAQGGRGAA